MTTYKIVLCQQQNILHKQIIISSVINNPQFGDLALGSPLPTLLNKTLF